MPPRFGQVSPFKNVQANIAKKEQWHTELPLSTTSIAEASDGIKATDQYAIARGSSVGSIIFLPYSQPGKQAQKAATWSASGRPITDFDTSYLEPLITASSEDGRISVSPLPDHNDVLEASATSSSSSSPISPSSVTSLSASAQKAVEVVQFHPTSSSLLLTNQGSTLQVWDYTRGGEEASALYTAHGPQKGHWSASWSRDGRLIQTAGKDNTINLWDIRQSAEKPSMSTSGHQGFNKAMRITSVGDLVFSTGFTKTRDREIALWDPRQFDKPLTKQILDTNTGVLMPLVDQARKMIYLIGRSDMSMRWAEVVNDSSFTIGMAPLPVPSQGAALVPQTSQTLNVMQAEVQKLVLLSSDAVLPVTMQVPRRTYLDFHGDLFPPIQAYQQPAQDASAWAQENDTAPPLVTPQPGKQWNGEAQASSRPANAEAQNQTTTSAPPSATPSASDAPKATVLSTTPSSTAKPTPIDSKATKVVDPVTDKLASLDISSPSLHSPSAKPSPAAPVTTPKAESSSPSPSPSQAPSRSQTQSQSQTITSTTATRTMEAPKPTQNTSQSAQSQQKTSQSLKPAVHWSRAYLAGKTALKPDFEDVQNINSTTSASVQLLKANTRYFFYPLSGPGGRLAFYPTAKKGRLPVHPPTLASGHDIVDFCLDPFDEDKVYIANNDGKIRVYKVPGGHAEGDHSEATTTLEDSMDKLLEIVPHPALKDVLLSASEDHGVPNVRVWDVSAKSVAAKVEVPGKGIHSIAWDHLGNRVAVACKDKKLRIFDARSSNATEESSTGPLHDSVRPAKVIWLDSTHLVTSGFSKTAFREVLLHRLSSDGKSTGVIAKTNIDISPAPLFPVYDEDTKILFVYSKGERTCHSFEVVNLDSSNGSKDAPAFNKLPSFEHGSLQLSFAFLPKQTVDVKAVDVAQAYRLTAGAIQHVRFSIPRAKMDFFQDDVYPDCSTRELMQSDNKLTLQAWLGGSSASHRRVNLRPDGMPLLSEAPPPPPRLKQQVMAKQLSEEESQQKYLDSLFKNKQAEVDSDEDDERLRKRDQFVDDDDDW